MKQVYLILFVAFLFAGCKKGDSQDPNNLLGGTNSGNIVLPGTLASDGVEIWTKEAQITADDYYSQIDTVIQSKSIVRSIKYAVGQTESGSVAWTINGKSYAGIDMNAKTWNGNIQKWVITNNCVFDISEVKSNLKIEAQVNINGNVIRRLKTIPTVLINKHVSDAIGYTLGTNRQDMTVSADYSPTLARKDSIPLFLIYYFEFTNSKLSSINLITKSQGYMDNLVMRSKIPTKLTYAGTSITNPQEWIKGTLNIKVQNMDMSLFLNTTSGADMWMFLSIKKQS